MITQAARRFYREAAAVTLEEAGATAHSVTLDGRAVKTPGGAALALPTQSLAEVVAAEWSAQGNDIAPATMPQMQLACTALDRVRPNRRAIVDETVAYGGSDLLCYWAETPPDLVYRQETQWQPVLNWLAQEIGVKLLSTQGIGHVDQSAEAMDGLAADIEALDDFELTAVAQLTRLTGSLVLAIAVARGHLAWSDALEASLLDESYQSEKWGEDREAMERRRALSSETEAAARFLELVRS